MRWRRWRTTKSNDNIARAVEQALSTGRCQCRTVGSEISRDHPAAQGIEGRRGAGRIGGDRLERENHQHDTHRERQEPGWKTHDSSLFKTRYGKRDIRQCMAGS